ncbi:MAG: transglycosylase domain-containing protein [Bulleidia sp.]|nr:transglycosylase domain-containing protein [Bulleidia sp.]
MADENRKNNDGRISFPDLPDVNKKEEAAPAVSDNETPAVISEEEARRVNKPAVVSAEEVDDTLSIPVIHTEEQKKLDQETSRKYTWDTIEETVVSSSEGKKKEEAPAVKKAEPAPVHREPAQEKKTVSEAPKPSVKKHEEKKSRRAEDPDATKIYTARHEDPEVVLKKDKERKKRLKKQRRLKIWTGILCAFVILYLIVGAVGLTIVNRMTSNAPALDVTDFISEESSKIYDDQGQIITEVGVLLRENVAYDQLPESVVDAFLSVEDSRFFTHFGFDIPRFTMAAIQNLKSHDFSQGGSTFTMQLVKNTYFTTDATATSFGSERAKSIEYKVQQIYLAIKLERLLSKKEIFQLYLNRLNFGGNIRGIQRASQYYFGKDVTDLTLPESAMLAGIINLPNRYNPYAYLDYGTERRNEVLYQMYNHGYIDETEYNLAKAIKVEDLLVGEQRKATEDSEYQSYLDVVLNEVTAMTGTDPTVKGMEIYTYLNRDMQQQVEDIENGNVSNVYFPDDLMQCAIISVDNRTGAIVAIGGGRNYDGARLLNRATMNYKQPGSSVKPVLSYALAFEYLGYSLDEVLVDKPITYPLESRVLVNFNGRYAGDVSIKDAVGDSLNIPAILTLEKVLDKVGQEKVVSYLNSIGFSHVNNDNFHYSYAIGGTSFETTVEELAGAHAMLINGGVYNKPHTIEKIVMSKDGTEYYPEDQNKQVLSSGSAWLACQLEYNAVFGNYSSYLRLLRSDYPVYAKTGTTDWGQDGLPYGIPEGVMKDKWMVSNTSHFTNAVWVGYDQAIAGKDCYFNSYKSSLNIPGNIQRTLLDKEAELFGAPEEIARPSDVEDVTYVYGTYPHVKVEDWMTPGVGITSQVSTAGLKSQPLITAAEYNTYLAQQNSGLQLSAQYDGTGSMKIMWSSEGGPCSGSRDISLHDPYNDIEAYGACLADLNWLVTGGSGYWATVTVDGNVVNQLTSATSAWTGYVGELYGNVQVCGGAGGSDTGESSCVVASYTDNVYGGEGYWDEATQTWIVTSTTKTGGYYDTAGNWIDDPNFDSSQYGSWDANGNWIGSGWWNTDGYHMS